MKSTENCDRSVDLTLRNEIRCGLAAGLDQAQIARLVGFARCSMRREVRRQHVAEVGHRAYLAQSQADAAVQVTETTAQIGRRPSVGTSLSLPAS